MAGFSAAAASFATAATAAAKQSQTDWPKLTKETTKELARVFQGAERPMPSLQERQQRRRRELQEAAGRERLQGRSAATQEAELQGLAAAAAGAAAAGRKARIEPGDRAILAEAERITGYAPEHCRFAHVPATEPSGVGATAGSSSDLASPTTPPAGGKGRGGGGQQGRQPSQRRMSPETPGHVSWVGDATNPSPIVTGNRATLPRAEGVQVANFYLGRSTGGTVAREREHHAGAQQHRGGAAAAQAVTAAANERRRSGELLPR